MTVGRRRLSDIPKEEAFRRMEKSLLRRERNRLIRARRLLPEAFSIPQFLVRNPNVEGGWSPFVGEFL